LKSISGKAFAKILEKKGWILRRISGSHHIYVKEGAAIPFLYLFMVTNLKDWPSQTFYEGRRNQ